MNKLKIVILFFVLCFTKDFSFLIKLRSSSNTENVDWTKVYKKYKYSVIQIFSTVKEYNYFRPFANCDTYKISGSGFFIGDGYVLTNYHIVNWAEEIEAQVPGLSKLKFKLEVLKIDPANDIALLRLTDDSLSELKKLLKIDDLVCFELESSGDLSEAEDIMILGYPLGLENLKISRGQVSGRESIDGCELIQTTAPINSGNSGGPCLDKSGKVVGITKSKIEEAEGIGYLIPSSKVMLALKNFEKVKIIPLANLGCSVMVATVNTLKSVKAPEDGGVYVTEVIENLPFGKAGLLKGDVIYKIDDLKIDRFGYVCSEGDDCVTFVDYLFRYPLESVIKITIYRDGVKKDLELKIPTIYPFKIRKISSWIDELPSYLVIGGLVLRELTLNDIWIIESIIQDSPQAMSIFWDILKYGFTKNREESRVFVSTVLPKSQAAEVLGLGFGILINKVNGKIVNTIEEVKEAILSGYKNEYLTVESDNGEYFALSISSILEQEDRLAKENFFEKSDLVKQLEEERESLELLQRINEE